MSAGRVHGDPRGDVECAIARRVAHAHAGHPTVVNERGDRLDVIREDRAQLGRRERERERQPVRLGRDVVVHDRGACQPLPPEAREPLNRVAP